jgi:UDP-N-acetylmuramoyl-tripeptide--D-alanyl-D-alanine ligase
MARQLSSGAYNNSVYFVPMITGLSIAELYNIFLQHPSVITDSRKLKQGDIFFALKGGNFNGNIFALQALQLRAAYAVIDEQPGEDHANLILVDNVLTTLQELAKHHREQLAIPFIGITGSNGKTTTKELINAVLASAFKTYTTQGNLNNHIGVPLTLLSIKKDAQMAVIEMGANHQKEIEQYCKWAQPTHAIITNCGKAHLEGFGGIEGVRKAKGELYDFVRSHNGVAFAYNEYEYFYEMSKGIREVVWYGINEGTVCGNVLSSEPFLEIKLTKGFSFDTIKTNLVGDYNLPNVLCAITIGKYFLIDDEKIKTAIENYIPSNSRSQLIEVGSNKIILDAYNANPTSMKAAIENFMHIPSNNKILILGGMMELGAESIYEHTNLISLINNYAWKNVLLVGGDFKNVPHNFLFVSNAEEAAQWLKQQHFQNSYFLIKGSRSVQLEKVLTAFEISAG